jgi:hypothetical protein
LELRGEILSFLLGDLLSQRKRRAGNHQVISRKEAGVSSQEGAQENLDKLVEEELGEDNLDKELKLLVGLQSKRDQYIHF